MLNASLVFQNSPQLHQAGGMALTGRREQDEGLETRTLVPPVHIGRKPRSDPRIGGTSGRNSLDASKQAEYEVPTLSCVGATVPHARRDRSHGAAEDGRDKPATDLQSAESGIDFLDFKKDRRIPSPET